MERRPPKLRQRSNGSLFAYFYDPGRTPTRKRVYLGVVIEDKLEEPLEEAPSGVVSRFYDEYHDPYLRSAYDPWEDEGEPDTPALSKVITQYVERGGITDNTKRTVRTTLEEFQGSYVEGDPKPGGVLEDHVRQYIFRDDLSDSYQKSLYARLHAAFAWMEGQGMIGPDENPMESIEKPRIRDKTKTFLEPSEWQALVRRIQDDYDARVDAGGRKGIKEREVIWILPILKFGTGTGMRPSEIKRLRVEDVGFDTGQVRVPVLEGNKGSGRTVPLCPMAEEVAREAIKGKVGTDYLFSGARSEQFCSRRLSRNVKKYIEQADGVRDDVNLYEATRHTFGSWLGMLGYSARTIKGLMGHSTITVTEKYMHISSEMMGSNMAKHAQDFANKVEGIGFFESPLRKAAA